jgi:hypothetical protein
MVEAPGTCLDLCDARRAGGPHPSHCKPGRAHCAHGGLRAAPGAAIEDETQGGGLVAVAIQSADRPLLTSCPPPGAAAGAFMLLRSWPKREAMGAFWWKGGEQ